MGHGLFSSISWIEACKKQNVVICEVFGSLSGVKSVRSLSPTGCKQLMGSTKGEDPKGGFLLPQKGTTKPCVVCLVVRQADLVPSFRSARTCAQLPIEGADVPWLFAMNSPRHRSGATLDKIAAAKGDRSTLTFAKFAVCVVCRYPFQLGSKRNQEHHGKPFVWVCCGESFPEPPKVS